MYMAGFYMIHSGLHWSSDGSEDLALWSFAVDHVAWVYDRIPQQRSGITPLEFLTVRYKTLHKTTGNSWLCAFSCVEDIESESSIQGNLLQASNPVPCDSRALRAYNLRRVDIQAPFFHQIYQVYILNRPEAERIHSLPVPTYRKSCSLSL